MTTDVLSKIVEEVKQREPLVAKKLIRNLARMSSAHAGLANQFLEKYAAYLDNQGRDLHYGVDCYLRLLGDMMVQRREFLQRGRYCNESYQAVNEQIYSNPEIMDYHMHGLVLAQFLWPDQYDRYQFFRKTIPSRAPIESYLEVGGGHGLYVMAAREMLNPARLDVVDISPSSLALAEGILADPGISYFCEDIFKFTPPRQYEFITMGEVLEHVENPLEMLKRIRELLAPGGTVYLTTPANAPMIDHIYLFRNADEIRQLLATAEFQVAQECLSFSEDVSPEEAERLKLPLMYAAFLS